jgi:hypothetical protein
MPYSRKPRVAILIAHSFGETFESLRAQVQPKIWARFEENEIDVFYALGNQPNSLQRALDAISVKFRYSKYLWVIQRLLDRCTLDARNTRLPKVQKVGDTLKVDFPEGHRYMGVKMIAAFKYLFEQQYDIVYRTTLSTIVIPENFKRVVDAVDNRYPFYGGTRVSLFEPSFVSGANLFLNDKALKYILDNIQNWHHWDLDDVAIGKMLNGEIEITELKSINISSLEDVENIDYKNLGDAVHIRCKSNNPIRNDKEIMTEVLRRLGSI